MTGKGGKGGKGGKIPSGEKKGPQSRSAKAGLQVFPHHNEIVPCWKNSQILKVQS
jgi:hypothetical protein